MRCSIGCLSTILAWDLSVHRLRRALRTGWGFWGSWGMLGFLGAGGLGADGIERA